MLAKYTVMAEWWVDMPEALPRARARVKAKGSSVKAKRSNDVDVTAEVVVNDDGSLTYDPSIVEVDEYKDPKYEAIRNEVRLSSRQGTFATGVNVRPVATNERSKRGIEIQEDE